MKIRITLGATLLLVGACMPVRVVDYQKSSNIDLKQFKTYSYHAIEEPETKGAHFSENMEILIHSIDSEMSRLGYTKMESDGDLLLNIGISVDEKIQTRETNFREDGMRYMGQRNYHWESQEVEVNRYKEGTIAIDFVDAKNKQLVWQGTVAGTVTDNRKKIEQRINTAIANLFKKFPQ